MQVGGFFTPPGGGQLIRQLFGFQRVHLEPGASAKVVISANAAAFATANEAGDFEVHPGDYRVELSNGATTAVACAGRLVENRTPIAPFPGREPL